MLLQILTLLSGATSLASATNLYVASYAGTVTTLSLTEVNGSFTLNETHITQDCAPNPSWLTLDQPSGILYCLNEGLTTPNGSLSTFTTSPDGTLTHIQNTTTITGPVSGILYGSPNGARGIALAHYAGAAVSTWTITGAGNFAQGQNFTYTLSQPGPVKDRQTAPHEHEAITDPTGKYILVPDLGADLVRVFSYDITNLQLTERDPLHAIPGSGPRHAAFWNPYGVVCEGCTTFLYVVGELDSTVTGYRVTYLPNGGGLSFTQVFRSSTFGYLARPAGNAPAEIQVAPSNRHLIISNRNDTSFTIPNPNPANSTALPSDSLSTFTLNADGTLSFTQLAPAYGSYPRHFTTNAAGNLVAVGLQNSGEVVILARDVCSGLIGQVVASVEIEGQVTAVVWDEEYALGRLGA